MDREIFNSLLKDCELLLNCILKEFICEQETSITNSDFKVQYLRIEMALSFELINEQDAMFLLFMNDSNIEIWKKLNDK